MIRDYIDIIMDAREEREARFERNAEHRGYINPNQFDVSDDVLVRLEKEPGYDASGAYADVVEQAKAIANKYGINVIVEHSKVYAGHDRGHEQELYRQSGRKA